MNPEKDRINEEKKISLVAEKEYRDPLRH